MNPDQLADSYVHGLLSAEDARSFEKRCAESEEAASALARANERLRLLQSLPPAEPSTALAGRTIEGVKASERSRMAFRTRLVLSSCVGVAAAVLLLIGAGWHYSRIKPTGPDLAVLGQSSLIASSTAVVRVRLFDRKASEPMAGVPVSVQLVAADGRVADLAEAETDERGDAAPRVKLPDWAEGNYQLRVTGGGEEVLRPVSLTRPFKVMLSSDKPIHQPGQVIKVRALALRASDLVPLANEPAVFLLTDPRDNVLFKHVTRTSKYGIASVECPLDPEIAEGMYTITCRVGSTESKLAAEVKRYVLPKFTIALTPHRPYYAPGETAKVSVKATYTFGKAVAGAEVDVRMITADAGERDAGRQVTKTGQDGKADVQFTIPMELRHFGESTVRFVAGVTDTAGQHQAKAASRPVSSTLVKLDVLPECGALVLHVPNIVHLLARRIDGDPLGNTPIEVEGAGVHHKLTTDATGVASFEIVPKTSTVELTFRVRHAPMEAFAETRTLRGGEADFLLRPDRASYRAGQTLNLSVLAFGREPVFVDILRAGQTVLSETVEMTKGRGSLAVDLPADVTGTLRVVAYRFSADGTAARQERLVHVAPAGGLKVLADFDREEYRPGQEAMLRLSLRDEKGNPVAGAVSLAAVDEAVFAVQAQRPGMEQYIFTLEQELLRPVYSVYAWSPGDAPSPRREKAAFAAASRSDRGQTHTLAATSFPAKETAVNALRGVRLDQVKKGWAGLGVVSLLLVYASLSFYLPVRGMLIGTGIVAGGMMFGVVTLLALNNAPPGKVSPLADFAVAGREKAMDKGGPRGGKVRFAHDEVDTKKDAMPPAPLAVGMSQAPRLRQHFPETMYWNPEAVSDDKGAFAPISIPLADTITTWRLTASAVSGDGQMGATVKPLRVFQPFFVDLDLPVMWTRNDEVTVPVVVYSYLDVPQKVAIKMEVRGGLDLLGNAEATLEMGPREVKSVRFPLRAARVGRPRLTVTARAGDVADAIEREVVIEPDGRRVEGAFNGDTEKPATFTIEVPADAIEGSLRADLKVYPSRFSQLVEGLDGIFRMPSGCFEQTSSTTYPNVLALQYLKQTKQAAPKVEAKARQYIHLGYQRLVGFEVNGGGFDWYGRPPGHVGLTAYGLLQFEDMAKVHDVDAKLLDRTRAWLLSKRDSDGSWKGEWKSTSGKLGTTAYVAWAVFSGGKESGQADASRRYLLGHKPGDVKDPYVLALVCLALDAVGAAESEKAGYLEMLASLRKNEGDRKAYWAQAKGERTAFHGSGLSGQVEATATATLALMSGKRHPELVRQALAWIVSKKDSAGTWYSTQATVLALKALIVGSSAPADRQDRTLEVVVNGKKQAIKISAGEAEVLRSVNLTPYLRPGRNEVTVSGMGGTSAGYQLAFRHNIPGSKEKPVRGPLGIAVTYDRTKLDAGGEVKATARAVNNTLAALQMVMLDLPVPPGFTVDTSLFEEMAREGRIGKFQAGPRQILVYLRALEPGKPLEMTYTLRAKLAMKAASAPARVYEYYDPTKSASTVPVRFEVR